MKFTRKYLEDNYIYLGYVALEDFLEGNLSKTDFLMSEEYANLYRTYHYIRLKMTTPISEALLKSYGFTLSSDNTFIKDCHGVTLGLVPNPSGSYISFIKTKRFLFPKTLYLNTVRTVRELEETFRMAGFYIESDEKAIRRANEQLDKKS